MGILVDVKQKTKDTKEYRTMVMRLSIVTLFVVMLLTPCFARPNGCPPQGCRIRSRQRWGKRDNTNSFATEKRLESAPSWIGNLSKNKNEARKVSPWMLTVFEHNNLKKTAYTE
ncbi:uncharacterized protein [Antedon mediterranea]|uniref:uncharacterized protein isoform X2 n=1 Tax=Antedon mediterranea TaxID=105859 RepID=UPI003AF4B6EE